MAPRDTYQAQAAAEVHRAACSPQGAVDTRASHMLTARTAFALFAPIALACEMTRPAAALGAVARPVDMTEGLTVFLEIAQ